MASISSVTLQTLTVRKDTSQGSGLILELQRQSGQSSLCLAGVLGGTISTATLTQLATEQPDSKLTYDSPDATLTVVHTNPGNTPGFHRYDVTWLAKTSGKPSAFKETFDLEGAHWYGLTQRREHTWPLEKWEIKLQPFVASDSFQKNGYGGVLEPYLLTSKGVAILLDSDNPLFLGVNQGGSKKVVCQAQYSSPYRNPDKQPLRLKYSIFQADTVRSVHQLVYASNAIPRPVEIPCERVFREPIWTTWAKYKTKISQTTVMEFAKEIKRQGFPACQIEIDDDWTPAYGDMEFDPKKFPDPKSMVAEVNALGYRVTLWVHPFASPVSRASRAHGDYWMKSPLGGFSTWWNGLGRCLDVTHPQARDWYKQSLGRLREQYGVSSFKFDAGESNWFPSGYRTQVDLASPNQYTQTWAQLGYDLDTEVRCQEVRVGYRTQNLPLWVRMMDKDSRWGHVNGLRTLIPHALTFSLLGYPFVLPDMVGGNAYKTTYPSKELFIRWLQANVFLPCIQFSICPWDYDEETVTLARDLVSLHHKHSDLFIRLGRECCQTGEPILRPLWWIAPTDLWAQATDSQFLVGNRLLVAPVLEEGAVSRDIYLPFGRWRDEVKQEEVDAGEGRWLREYPAGLDTLPHFTLLSDLPNLTLSLGTDSKPQTDTQSG